MPSFDDEDFDMTSDSALPDLPQDQDTQPETPESIHDLPPAVLGAGPQPVTQLGLASNYWRDHPVATPAPDPLDDYLNQKNQRLWDGVLGSPPVAPDQAPTGLEPSSYRVPTYPWEDPANRANPPGKAGIPIAIDDNLSKLPQEVIMTIGRAGTAIEAEPDNVMQSADIQNLVATVPSWAAADKARPMSGQAEMFIPSESKIVLATSGAHGSNSANLVFHAIAHAYGKASGDADQSDDFKNAWNASTDYLTDPYYRGDSEKLGDPAEVARAQREAYAESFARHLAGQPNLSPAIDQYWQQWSKDHGW